MFGYIDDDETRAIVESEYLDTRGNGCRRVPGCDTETETETDDFCLDTARVGVRLCVGFEILNRCEQ